MKRRRALKAAIIQIKGPVGALISLPSIYFWNSAGSGHSGFRLNKRRMRIHAFVRHRRLFGWSAFK